MPEKLAYWDIQLPEGYSPQEAGCPSTLASQAPKAGFNYMHMNVTTFLLFCCIMFSRKKMTSSTRTLRWEKQHPLLIFQLGSKWVLSYFYYSRLCLIQFITRFSIVEYVLSTLDTEENDITRWCFTYAKVIAALNLGWWVLTNFSTYGIVESFRNYSHFYIDDVFCRWV